MLGPMRVQRIVLELLPDSAPISGAVLAEGLEPRRFEGWMQLIAAVEDARSREFDVVGGADD
jgi:hypothetical protein